MTWWIGYARSETEFRVRDDIRALGVRCEVPLEIYAKHVPKKGIIPAERPILRNYLFIACDDHDWHRVRRVKGLAPTMQAVSDPAARAQLLPFIGRAMREYEDRRARIEAGERVAQYQEGDPVLILAGRLEGHIARFRRMVEAAWPPRVVVDVGAMAGRPIQMQLDALHVGRADPS